MDPTTSDESLRPPRPASAERGARAPTSVFPPKLENFVGRESEIAQIELELDAAEAGLGRILVVRGEPGIGKTWLVRQALARRRERARGVAMRWVRCSDGIGTPAYWTWKSLLGEGLSEAPPASCDAAHSDSKRPDRFERLRAVRDDVLKASGGRPLFLFIDDLQWADAESIAVLDHLARRIEDWPIAIVATERTAGARDEAAASIEALSVHRVVRRLDVAGFTERDVARFLEMTLGAPPDSDAVRTWHRVTGGNPYFVDELTRSVRANGAGPSDVVVSLPGNIQQLIEQRIRGCDPAVRELLELAAVIGRDFSLTLVRRLSKEVLDHAEIVPEALDAAIAARLLESADAPDHFRFVHALVPQAILDPLPRRRRSSLHGHVGRLLAAEPALRAGGRPEVARHLSAAARVLPAHAEAALFHSTWAGYEAAAEQSHTLAAAHYRDAMAALAERGATPSSTARSCSSPSHTASPSPRRRMRTRRSKRPKRSPTRDSAPWIASAQRGFSASPS